MLFDWRKFHESNADRPIVVDPRLRMKICLWLFAAVLTLVFGRVVQLEYSHGAAFRREALKPRERKITLPAARGRILARDGTVLVRDRPFHAVAVAYRRLKGTPDERLALLCGVSPEKWAARAKKIRSRVERIAALVNRRARSETAPRDGGSWAKRLCRLLLDDVPAQRIIVKEELLHHVMADDVSEKVVAEIENHPDRYPGARIVKISRRVYEQGTLAAHAVGYLGKTERGEFDVGLTGVERQCENLLRGRDGLGVELIDRGRRVVSSHVARDLVPGRDVVLTIDPNLQRAAEELLRSAIRRGQNNFAAKNQCGGAAAVMDVNTGALLTMASAPTFDPNLFARGDGGAVAALLADESHPLFNRAAQMAIPPGSVFKIVTAVALLESDAVDPQETFNCRGFLHSPESRRCEIYVRRGVGHGEVTLADALAVSCNVYFFHYAGRMGPRPLVDWAERFGFGRPTGVDLPGEAAGVLPALENDAELLSVSVGQGSLAVTPLQVLRMTAAVANGGRLVAPHVVQRGERGEERGEGSAAITFHSLDTLAVLRDGLERVVADQRGTAHDTVYLESLPIAGKTGTAETGESSPSHGWFAGYVPADEPKYAVVVALEHSGDGAASAGPVVKRLVLRMRELGML
ncbi:MAG: hypothetical protein JW959_04455 [Pirellulales bacterium]|nr:hypothetical protein [Pirellulales bacterium]